jgi:hypothetical protein
VRYALTLLVFALPLAAAPVPKSLKKPPPLDGDWRWETEQVNGGPATPSDNGYNLWRVKGDTLQMIRESGAADERASSCLFTSVPREGGSRSFEYTVNSNGYHRRGLCEFDGDCLRVSWVAHDTGLPNGVVYTFKRVKP